VESPADEDARIAKMKDGRTHLAHKAEHAVDLTRARWCVTLQGRIGATRPRWMSVVRSRDGVAEQVGRGAELRPDEAPRSTSTGIEETVTDKGYHSGAVVKRMKAYGVRSYIPEKKTEGAAELAATASSKQCTRTAAGAGRYGKSLLRRRGELVERSFAHCYETAG